VYKNKLWLGWLIGTWPMWFVLFCVIAYFANIPVKEATRDVWIRLLIFCVCVQLYWLTGWKKAFGSWRGAFGKKYQE
jgi:hypothetical protein